MKNFAKTIRDTAADPEKLKPFPEVEADLRQIEKQKQFDQLDSKTKRAFDELRLSVADSDEARELAHIAGRVRRLLGEEKRAAGLDWKARILAGPIKRLALNAVARALCEKPLTGPQSEALALYKKGLGGDTSPGSTLLIEELDTELWNLLLEYGAWATLGVRPMSRESKSFPFLTAWPTAQFIAEGTGWSDDAVIAGSTVANDADVIGVLLNVSNRLLEDINADIATDLLDAFEQSINARLDHACFRGDGVADGDNGGITGIFDSSSGVPVFTAANGNTTFQQLEAADVYNTIATVDAAVLQRRPRWWFNPSFLPLAMRLKDGNDKLLKADLDMEGNTLFTFAGFNVTLTAAAPSTNSAGQRVAAFGLGASYAVGVRKQFTFESSSHFRWDYNQSTFRAYARATGKMRVATGLAILETAAS